MNLATLTTFLGWATLINIVVLLFSTAAIVGLRNHIATVHQRLFGLNGADLGRAYFQYLAQYKIAVLVFNLTPYLALKFMGV